MTYKIYEVIVYADGTKTWSLDDKLHREDGPAFEEPYGYKAWYLNDERHREDGPAIEWDHVCKHWYLNGTKYTEAEWKAKLNPVKELSVKEISDLLGYEVKVVK
tara:strand:- start:316 stop:627 length:312 start_codon:yes stop_codon:yes gene_type:complete